MADNTSSEKIHGIQRETDELVAICRDNLEKALKRGQNVELLGTRADSLADHASKFKQSSAGLSNAMWLKNTGWSWSFWTILLAGLTAGISVAAGAPLAIVIGASAGVAILSFLTFHICTWSARNPTPRSRPPRVHATQFPVESATRTRVAAALTQHGAVDPANTSVFRRN